LPYTAGAVAVNGKPLHGPSAEAANGVSIAGAAAVADRAENVLLPIEFRKLPTADYRQSALDLLQMVGLQDFAGRFPYELSAACSNVPRSSALWCRTLAFC